MNITTDIKQEELLLIYTPEELIQLRANQIQPTLSNKNTIFYYEDRQGKQHIFKEVFHSTIAGFLIGMISDTEFLQIHCLGLKVKGKRKQ